MTWILFALVAVIGICIGILARQIEALEADLMKTKSGLGHAYINLKKTQEAEKDAIDAMNGAIEALNDWNKDLCECLEQAVTNLEETDRRCRDIERYYINYVSRKEDNGEI